MPPRSARQLPAVAARLVVEHQALAWFPLATVAVDMAAAATVAAIRGPSQSASALAAAAVDPSTLGDALADAPTALDGGITVALAVIVGSAITDSCGRASSRRWQESARRCRRACHSPAVWRSCSG